MAGAASYDLQMVTGAADFASASVISTGSASEYEIAAPYAYDTTVHWRVRPVNGDGVPGAWSATFSFEVAWTVSVGTISPVDGGNRSEERRVGKESR